MKPSLLGTAWLIARKDLAIEFRTRTAFLAALVFALLGIAIFYFAWDPTAVAAIDLAPGVLWVIFTFSGLLGLQRSFGVEQADRAMDGLLAAHRSIARRSISARRSRTSSSSRRCRSSRSRAVALLLQPSVAAARCAICSLIAVLAAVGLVAVGTLFSAMAVNTRLAELLLPMLSPPVLRADRDAGGAGDGAAARGAADGGERGHGSNSHGVRPRVRGRRARSHFRTLSRNDHSRQTTATPPATTIARARRPVSIGSSSLAVICIVAAYVRAIYFTPIEALQGPAQKIFYVHVAAALSALSRASAIVALTSIVLSLASRRARRPAGGELRPRWARVHDRRCSRRARSGRSRSGARGGRGTRGSR